MSPDGLFVDKYGNTHAYVWIARDFGNVSSNYVDNTGCLRPVLILKNDTQVSLGDGTKVNPFVVE